MITSSARSHRTTTYMYMFRAPDSTQLNSTQLAVWLSWVELSQALWTRRKLLKTGCDPVCSVWPIVACHDSEFSAYPTLRRKKALASIGIYYLLKYRRRRRQRRCRRKPWIMLHDEQGVYNNLLRELQLEGSVWRKNSFTISWRE